MSQPAKAQNYFTYFPDNYRWSAEMLAILSTGPYGGADIAEADRAGRRLRAHPRPPTSHPTPRGIFLRKFTYSGKTATTAVQL